MWDGLIPAAYWSGPEPMLSPASCPGIVWNGACWPELEMYWDLFENLTVLSDHLPALGNISWRCIICKCKVTPTDLCSIFF